MSGQEPAWSVKVALDDVPESGAHFDLVADEETRTHLAQAAGLRSLPRLTASFDVTRRGASGLHVIGEMNATVGQNCVVTLDPIENELHAGIDLVFVPDSRPTIADKQGEATVDFSQEAEPESFSDGAVDLGAIATEFLLLAIDPYPRKPDAVFEPRIAGDPAAHPFAALAALKGDKGKGKT